RTLPELVDVNTDQQDRGIQSSIVFDRSTAARLGLTPQMIDDTLYDAFGQRQVATTYTQLNQYRVVLEVKPDAARTPDSLGRIYVKPPTGAPVPLTSFATIGTSSTALAINHQGQFPSITLSFNLAENVALGQAVLAIH